MNEYQKKFLDVYCDGKKPRDKAGKEELALLGNMKSNRMRVHIPEFNGKPACIEEYEVADECDMPEGKIDVETLVSNLRL